MNTLNRAWQSFLIFRQLLRTWHNTLFFLYSSCRTVKPLRELVVLEARAESLNV